MTFDLVRGHTIVRVEEFAPAPVAELCDLGFMRWLTVNVPGDPDHHILLQKPGPPTMTDEVAAQIRDLVTKGALGLSLILTTGLEDRAALNVLPY